MCIPCLLEQQKTWFTACTPRIRSYLSWPGDGTLPIHVHIQRTCHLHSRKNSKFVVWKEIATCVLRRVACNSLAISGTLTELACKSTHGNTGWRCNPKTTPSADSDAMLVAFHSQLSQACPFFKRWRTCAMFTNCVCVCVCGGSLYYGQRPGTTCTCMCCCSTFHTCQGTNLLYTFNYM